MHIWHKYISTGIQLAYVKYCVCVKIEVRWRAGGGGMECEKRHGIILKPLVHS